MLCEHPNQNQNELNQRNVQPEPVALHSARGYAFLARMQGRRSGPRLRNPREIVHRGAVSQLQHRKRGPGGPDYQDDAGRIPVLHCVHPLRRMVQQFSSQRITKSRLQQNRQNVPDPKVLLDPLREQEAVDAIGSGDEDHHLQARTRIGDVEKRSGSAEDVRTSLSRSQVVCVLYARLASRNRPQVV